MIPLDDSIEHLRSGLTGLIISLPKQENLSYLLKFNTQEGKEKQKLRNVKNFSLYSRSDVNRFVKQLISMKSASFNDDPSSCHFDKRTEESSAVQYFQVKSSSKMTRRKNKRQKFFFVFSFMVIYLNSRT